MAIDDKRAIHRRQFAQRLQEIRIVDAPRRLRVSL
jgi:hypothetical protein